MSTLAIKPEALVEQALADGSRLSEVMSHLFDVTLSTKTIEFFPFLQYPEFMFQPPERLLKVFEDAGLSAKQARMAATAIIQKTLSDPNLNVEHPDRLSWVWNGFEAELKSESKQDPGPLPENPVRYADRKLHPEYAHMNAVEFLREVWGKWIDTPGAVYQDDIGKRDDTLIPNVRSHCQRMKLVAKDILPPPRQVRTTEGAKADPTGRSLRALEAKRRADLASKRNSLYSIPKTY